MLLIAVGALALVVTGEDNDTASPETVGDVSAKTEKKSIPTANKRKANRRKPKHSKSSKAKNKKDKVKSLKVSVDGSDKGVLPKVTGDKNSKSRSTLRSTAAPKNKRDARRILAAGKSEVDGHHLGAARLQYQRVLKGKYLKAQANLGMAKVLFEQGKYKESASYAKRAGSGVDAQVALADAYYKMGKHRQALRLYDKILVRNPDKKSAIQGRSAAKNKLGN